MKQLLFALVAILATNFTPISAGPKEEGLVTKDANGDYCYEKVFEVPGVSQKELFNRGKKWVTANLITEDNHAKFDEEEFSITSTPSFAIKPLGGWSYNITAGTVTMKAHFYFKDGKYKLRLDNITAVVKYSNGVVQQRTYDGIIKMPNKPSNHLIKEVDEIVLSVSGKSLKSLQSDKPDNW
jgi:hypothetical protein